MKYILILFALPLIACGEGSSDSCSEMPWDVQEITVGSNIDKGYYPSFTQPDLIQDDGITCHEVYNFGGNINGLCKVYEIKVGCESRRVDFINGSESQ